MTNPDNTVGTNAAFGGRTSVNAFNDNLAIYSRGIMSGWTCAPDSGMTVVLGGDGSTRDVAVAEDNAGNKTTINNISGAPVSVTLEAAPGANSRIDAIVAYVDNPPQGSATIADNYEACGLISVSGTASSSPVEPSDGAIRAAITADGASGVTAYYVVLATVTVASGTTDITADVITPGVNAMIQARNLDIPAPALIRKNATLNTTYTSGGSIQYTQIGNLVLVSLNDVTLKSVPGGNTNNLATGLPNAMDGSSSVVIPNRGYVSSNPSGIRIKPVGTAIKFQSSAAASDLSQAFCGSFWYLTA